MKEKKTTPIEVTQEYALRHPVLSMKDIDSVSGNMVLNDLVRLSQVRFIRLTTAVVMESFVKINWYFVASVCYQNHKIIPLNFVGNKEKKLVKKELLRIAGNAGEGETMFFQTANMIRLERKLSLIELEKMADVTEEMVEIYEKSI